MCPRSHMSSGRAWDDLPVNKRGHGTVGLPINKQGSSIVALEEVGWLCIASDVLIQVLHTLHVLQRPAAELVTSSQHCSQVRSHAVSVLQQKDDDELMYYLLQLVQVGAHLSLSFSNLLQVKVIPFLETGSFVSAEKPPAGPKGFPPHVTKTVESGAKTVEHRQKIDLLLKAKPNCP